MMKNKIVAAAIATALCTPLVAQAKDNMPVIYGKAHISYGTVDTKVNGTTTVENWQARSHASRFGIKGSRKLSNSLKATYKFEWQIDYEQKDSDGDDNGGLSRRNMYAGLKGGFGEFRIGRHDTPLKMAQGKFDQFGDTDADLKNAGDEDGENRLDNMLIYLGSAGKVKYALAVTPGEDAASSTADEGPADTVSASISYKDGPLYFAVAHDTYENGGSLANDSITRVVGTYKFSGMQVGVLAQSGVEAADSATAEEDWLGVSFNAKVGAKGKFKAQYIKVEDNQTNALDGTLMAVGYDYKFDKKTTGYVMYSNLEEEQSGAKTLEKSFVGVGLVLKF